jgi:ubiquinol-cytochrome c reductase cytochrome b subunit
VFLAPEGGGYFLEYNNFIPADPLKTPPHIAPVWYFTPFYSMLRATTDPMVDVLCVIVAAAAVAAIVLKRRSARQRLAIALGAIAAAAAMKAVDAKFMGVVVMGGAVLILYLLPWLDRSPVRSIRFRPGWHRGLYGVLVVSFLVLGVLGTKPPTVWGGYLSQVLTLVYFGFFLLMPVWSHRGRFKPVPARVRFTPH